MSQQTPRRAGRPRFLKGFALASGLLLFLAAVAMGQAQAPPREKLPTLTSAKAAHQLSLQEADRGYPVHLRGTVTYDDPYIDPRQIAMFVQDASGGIFVRVPRTSMRQAIGGDLVDVRGFSASGDFAPIVSRPKVTILGFGGLPANAKPVSLTRLRTGVEDGQWVEVEGVIHSIFANDHDVTLQLAMADGTISVTLLQEPGVDYQALVDTGVRIHANAGPLYNANRQMIGARLLCPGMAAITKIDPGVRDPFAVPVSRIDELSDYRSITSLPHRIHLRGVLTLQWPGSLLCIQATSGALCARSTQKGLLPLGSQVDVAGFAVLGDYAPRLNDAVFRKTGSGGALEARPVTAEQASNGSEDSRLVQIEGVLIGHDLTASDATLMLASENLIFPVVIPKSMTGRNALALASGTRVRVTGICSVQVDQQKTERGGGSAVPQSFQILLRSAQDVIVTRKASWWTPRHALLVVSGMLTLSLLALGWIGLLQKRIEHQNGKIKESEARYRHMAQHDALTGLATRPLLHERIAAAIRRAEQTGGGLAILMLDLDGFKQINDTLGHQAGDETLQIAAKRITGVVRKTDTAARTGGDEFVILIDELHESREAELVAAKVVSVFAAPVVLGGNRVPLAVSVGVFVGFGAGLQADELLKNADLALYRAKAQGRSQFAVFEQQPVSGSMQKPSFSVQTAIGQKQQLPIRKTGV